MLVIDRFRLVDKLVNRLMFAFGAICAVSAAFVSSRAFLLVFLLILALIAGQITAFGISLFYRVLFPDGIPKLKSWGKISPSYHRQTAARYFGVFAETLLKCSFVSLLFLIISSFL